MSAVGSVGPSFASSAPQFGGIKTQLLRQLTQGGQDRVSFQGRTPKNTGGNLEPLSMLLMCCAAPFVLGAGALVSLIMCAIPGVKWLSPIYLLYRLMTLGKNKDKPSEPTEETKPAAETDSGSESS